MFFNNKDEGFTLLELVLALALVGIILSFSWPKLEHTYKRFKLEASAKKIIAQIRLVQQLSIGEGIWYRLKFDLVNNKYIITRNINNDGIAQVYKTIELEKPASLYFTNFKDHEVYFYSSGNPSQGGTITIIDENNNLLYIIICPVTGRTRLSNQPPN